MKDIVIIGGGAGGLAAALEAFDPSLDIMLVEREKHLGGILNQCIHNGFGLHVFDEELTGPEYAERFIQAFHDKKIPCLMETTILEIRKENDVFLIEASNKQDGLFTIKSKSVVLSSGCYERTRGQIQLPGERPKGIMPAGSAQRYLNIEGYLVGKDVFVLGSGDIGLIMARRMKLEGANVLGVAEIMPYSNGLTRNIVQCLDDYDIPLYLSHTVTDIVGKDCLESITISEVDADFKPIKGSEKQFDVDTLLLSVGLIPDTMVLESMPIALHPKTKGPTVDQTYQTSVEGLFVCGNALHVHDLVDYVTDESKRAGQFAKLFVQKPFKKPPSPIAIEANQNIHYVMPSSINPSVDLDTIHCAYRVTTKAEVGEVTLAQGDHIIKTQKVRFMAPAEMEHLTFTLNDLINHKDPITLTMEVVK